VAASYIRRGEYKDVIGDKMSMRFDNGYKQEVDYTFHHYMSVSLQFTKDWPSFRHIYRWREEFRIDRSNVYNWVEKRKFSVYSVLHTSQYIRVKGRRGWNLEASGVSLAQQIYPIVFASDSLSVRS
jgi:hypothetical protein